MSFTYKLVAILNKEIDTGVAMNALAHMTLGLGSQVDKTLLRLDTYETQDGVLFPNISQMPFMILRGKSNEIRKAVSGAISQKMQCGVFVETMTGGTYLDQLARTKDTQESHLVYYGAVILGPWDEVSLLTKRFSLYR
ncbi:MAG: DUF2000 domain-containing protein [Alphaproteobacteria bacterium]|nr:DUF2000 domain-containing protein [Alphaproteobacteria bacterium]